MSKIFSGASRDPNSPKPGATTPSTMGWGRATTPGTPDRYHQEMWLPGVVAWPPAHGGIHTVPPGEALEKRKNHLLLGRKRVTGSRRAPLQAVVVWSHHIFSPAPWGPKTPPRSAARHGRDTAASAAAAVRAGVCPGARQLRPAPAEPPPGWLPPGHCPPGPARPAGTSSPCGTALGTAKKPPPKQGVQRLLQHLRWWVWGHGVMFGVVRSPSYHGTFFFCTSNGPAVSQWSVPSPGNPAGGHSPYCLSQPQEPPTRPQNHVRPSHPSPSTWQLSGEGVTRGTAGVTAVAQGTLGRVLCVVPAGRRGQRLGTEPPPQDPHGAMPAGPSSPEGLAYRRGVFCLPPPPPRFICTQRDPPELGRAVMLLSKRGGI